MSQDNTNMTTPTVKALRQIAERAQGKTNADTNIKTVWAVREMALEALPIAEREAKSIAMLVKILESIELECEGLLEDADCDELATGVERILGVVARALEVVTEDSG